MKGKLDMGRKLMRFEGSAPGFFRTGEIAAVLKDDGTVPVESEEWIMAAMRGTREGEQAFTSCVGRGSRWQVDGLDFLMSSLISERGGRWKEENGRVGGLKSAGVLG